MLRWIRWFIQKIKYRLTGKKFKVVLSDTFKKQLEMVTEEDREGILEAIDEISKNPFMGRELDTTKCVICQVNEPDIGDVICSDCNKRDDKLIKEEIDFFRREFGKEKE